PRSEDQGPSRRVAQAEEEAGGPGMKVTETAWLKASSPIPLLPFLATDPNLRKLRLFLCACFRVREQRKWMADTFELDRAAVELAEQWADGLIDQTEVFASGVIRSNTIALFPNDGEMRHRAAEARLVKHDPPFTTSPSEEAVRVTLLRDIFGNPFR